jgi:putative peptidoglycan lipid II flippase
MIVRLRNREEGIRLKQLLGSMFSMTALVLLLLTVLLYFFIDSFVNVYVRGMDAQGKLMTAQMLRIIIPAVVAIGLISLFSAVLNAYKHYVVPSLGPIFYSSGVILAVIFLAPTQGVESLMLGMAAGIVLHLIVALVAMWKRRVSFRPIMVINEDVKKTGLLLWPIFISVGAFQLNLFVDRMMASTLAEGSIAALNYGNRVVQLPLSLFVGALVLPLFPVVAEKLSKGERAGTIELLGNVYRLLGILLLPVMGAFLVLGQPIISLLFQRGEFNQQSVEMTTIALVFYAFLLIPFAMRDVMTRAFYAMQDTWTPVINSVILVAINITLMLILVPKFGMMGVAGSTSLAALIAYIRLRWKLNKRLVAEQVEAQVEAQAPSAKAEHKAEAQAEAQATAQAPETAQAPSDKALWWRIWLHAVLFTVLLWGSYELLNFVWAQPLGWHLLLRLMISLTVAGLVYLFLTLKLDTDEVNWLKQKFRLRLPKRLTGS